MTHPPLPGLSRRAFLGGSAATLALSRPSLSRAAAIQFLPGRSIPQPIPFGYISAGGDLAHRTGQNFARLQESIYRPPALFRQTNWQSWPGDFEGRDLLAITLLSRATGFPPTYFPSMVAAYPAHLNPQGYFGPALNLQSINEQQLSGHGWFLRGLCELYDYQRSSPTSVPIQTAAQTLDQIRAVIRNLALPLRGKYAAYPIDPALRARASAPTAPGAVNGHLSAQHGDWAVSSDTGCAFIFLDGLTHAWVVLRSVNDPLAPHLKALIDEAIARFVQIDLVALKAQTHATLTALRAILRVYNETGSQSNDAHLLQRVQERYHLYRTSAMTAHYANTNWFGRPDSWTEPCAILDSFILATQLWQHTSDPAYLEDAHLIWFNAAGRGLRSNGGFGTDTCAGFSSPWLRVRSYEAYFCCTMRGGEGHARAIQSLYFTRLSELTVPFFAPSVATVDLGHGPIRLRQTTNYPYAGPVRIEIVSAPPLSPFKIRLFAPAWASAQSLTLNGRALRLSNSQGFLSARLIPKTGDVLQFDQTLRVGPRNPPSSAIPGNPPGSASLPGYYTFEAGPLVLGYRPADPAGPITLRSPNPPEVHIPRNATLTPGSTPGAYRVSGTDLTLGPINDLNQTPTTPHDPAPRQILFRQS